MKIVIVGGVAGALSAAARIRRLSEQAEVVMLEAGARNHPLPTAVAGRHWRRDRGTRGAAGGTSV